MLLPNGKLIKRKNNVILKGILLYVITRFALFLISYTFNIDPFLSYDDKYIYDVVSLKDNINYMHYIKQRQIWVIICAFLNQYRIGTFSVARVVNLIIFFLMCMEIKKLCFNMNFQTKVINGIFYSFLVLPYYIFYGSSMYKDIFISFCLFKIINLYIEYKNSKYRKINIISFLFFSILLYFFRFGIVESLIGLMMIDYLFNNKSKIKYLIIGVLILGILYFLANYYIYWYVFQQKINAYVNRDVVESGFLAVIRIKKISDLIKLPFLIVYSQLHPWLDTNIATRNGFSWANIIPYTALVQAFLLPSFWYSIFFVKKNLYEKGILIYYLLWLMALAVTNPELARFFYFISPIYYIFSIKIIIERKANQVILLGLFCVVGYVLLNLIK